MAVEVVGLVGRGFSVCSFSKVTLQKLHKPAATNKLHFGASADAPACSFRQSPNGQLEDIRCRPVVAAPSDLNIHQKGSQLKRHHLEGLGWALGSIHRRTERRRHLNVESLRGYRTHGTEACSIRKLPAPSCTGASEGKAAPPIADVQPASNNASGTEHVKHTYLFSVAALPSLAAAFYAPLAAGDIAVHLELKVPDLGVAIFTAAAALVWVRLFDELARRNVFERVSQLTSNRWQK